MTLNLYSSASCASLVSSSLASGNVGCFSSYPGTQRITCVPGTFVAPTSSALVQSQYTGGTCPVTTGSVYYAAFMTTGQCVSVSSSLYAVVTCQSATAASVTLYTSAGCSGTGTAIDPSLLFNFGCGPSTSGSTTALQTTCTAPFTSAPPITAAVQPPFLQELTPPTDFVNSNFGSSVISTLDASTILVPASSAAVGPFSYAGAAYVYSRNSAGVYGQAQKLVVRDPTTSSYFGYGVFSPDGTTIAFPMPNANNYAGAVYIFTRNSGTWTQTQKLTASDQASYAYFGTSVYFSPSGDSTLYVCANQANYAGAVYVFKLISGLWTQRQVLVASDASSGSNFGTGSLGGITFSPSGTYMYIGSYTGSSTSSCNLYAFGRSSSSGDWTQMRQQASIPIFESYGFYYSASPDGTLAAYSNFISDAVTIFSLDATPYATQLSQQQRLTPPDGVTGKNFGYNIAWSPDSTTLVVQSYVGPSLYFYQKQGGSLAFTVKFSVFRISGYSNSLGLAFSPDSQTLVTANYQDSGVLYMFTSAGGVWSLQQRLNAPTSFSSSGFNPYAATFSGDGSMLAVAAQSFTGQQGAWLVTRTGGVWGSTLNPIVPVPYRVNFMAFVPTASSLTLIASSTSAYGGNGTVFVYGVPATGSDASSIVGAVIGGIVGALALIAYASTVLCFTFKTCCFKPNKAVLRSKAPASPTLAAPETTAGGVALASTVVNPMSVLPPAPTTSSAANPVSVVVSSAPPAAVAAPSAVVLSVSAPAAGSAPAPDAGGGVLASMQRIASGHIDSLVRATAASVASHRAAVDARGASSAELREALDALSGDLLALGEHMKRDAVALGFVTDESVRARDIQAYFGPVAEAVGAAVQRGATDARSFMRASAMIAKMT